MIVNFQLSYIILHKHLLNRIPYIFRLATIFVALVLLVAILYYLQVVLVPLLIAVIFAVMLFPFALRLEKWGFRKGLAAFVTVFITTLLLGFLVYLIIVQLSSFFQQVPAVQNRMNSILDSIKEFAAVQLGMQKTEAADRIQFHVNQLEDYSKAGFANFLSKIPTLMIHIFLIPIYIFFLIYYRHFFLEFFYKVFHAEDKTDIDDTVENIGLTIKGYVFGLFLDVLIIGAANTIALYLIGIDYSIILGFGVALLCIIPYLGTIIGSVLVFLVALVTTTTIWQPLTAFGFMWGIHIIDSNIVAPYVIGSKVNINPLVAILILFMFGELWGLAGLFLAFPLAAILKVIFDRVNGLKPYGFLLGEPEKYHLKKYSLEHLRGKQNIEEMKHQTPLSDVLPGEPGQDPLPGDKA